jgi:hypothetical protein
MFTWICPQCGREVPPAYTECPDCTRKPQPVATAAPPPSAVAYQAPAAAAVAAAPPPPEIKPLAPPIEPEHSPAPPAPAPFPRQPRKSGAFGLPIWLATALSAVVIVGLVAGMYWIVNSLHGGQPARPTAAEESPGAKPGAAVSAIQKFIEVSSVRFLEDPKNKDKVLVKFVLTNHAEAELNGLAGNVTIWASTGRSEEDAQGTFEFATSLKGLESKELTAPLTGKKKIYELPDWQNLTSDVQITAPAS